MSTQVDAASVSGDPALLRIEGAIATITLNRPSAFNSIDLSIAKKLEQLSADVEASDDIRVLVIEGEGRAFCAGGDLQTIGAAAAADTIAPVVGELLQHYHAFITTLRRMPKVVLASVHGSAAGAGLSLAFVADLCIAAEDARFTPAYSKLGVSPDGGGTVGVVGECRHATRLANLSCRRQFFGRAGLSMGSGRQSRPAGRTEDGHPRAGASARPERTGGIGRDQGPDPPRPCHADRAAARSRDATPSSTACTRRTSGLP